jgi:phosphohistidine phosphatase SixA
MRHEGGRAQTRTVGGSAPSIPAQRRFSPDCQSSKTVILLCHASAHPKAVGSAQDRFRGLEPAGLWQAELLASSLASQNPPAILTSSARRCIETVEPLTRSLGLELQARPELAIGTTRNALRELITSCQPRTVLCTHREVIELLTGVGNAPQKAGAVVLEVDPTGERTLKVLPPPGQASLRETIGGLLPAR